MYPLGKVKIQWSRNFAYAIGLIASDGCLSKDGRHIDFSSKDEQLVNAFRGCLGIKNRIGRKSRSGYSPKKHFRVQVGDRMFHEFLESIGLHPAKSKTISAIEMPSKFFFDFFRGCIDGDGTIGVHRHPESKHLQLRLRLVSASNEFLLWMFEEIRRLAPEIRGGWVSKLPMKRIHNMTFGKSDSIKLLRRMYVPMPEYYLQRKHELARIWTGE